MSAAHQPWHSSAWFRVWERLAYHAALLLACVWSVSGASYYVATTGSDSNPGTLAQPWLTIQHAADTAAAGDTVNIGAGTFSEFITNNISGSAGNPITFQGTRSGTNWLTIIDPSTPFTNGWVAATEIGAGVYKRTGMPFLTGELTIAGRRVASVYDTNTIAGLSGIYVPDRTLGQDWLTLASAATVQTSLFPGHTFEWWDSVGALWSSTPTVTFLRLRDGSDPNGLDIRCAPRTAGTFDVRYRAVTVNAAYITWKDCAFRGAAGAFFLDQDSVHHITISGNRISNGALKVMVGYGVHDCTISGNTFTSDWYGSPSCGAWQGGGDSYAGRANMYVVSKFMLADSQSTYDDSVLLFNAGGNNVVCSNTFSQAAGEYVIIGAQASDRTTNTLVYANSFATSSDVGVLDMEFNSGTKIYGNTFSDCNVNLRPHHMDAGVGNDDRLVYVYRNTFYEPAGVGSHIYFHYFNDTPDTYFPTFWIYHNSFSGGLACIEPSSYIAGSGGATNTHFLNNVFSGSAYVLGDSFGGANYSFWTNSLGFGSFDYNLTTPPAVTYPSTNNPSWWQANNIKANVAVWSTASVPTFALPSNSQAIGAAIDVTHPFTVGGVTYPALPATSIVKIGTAWDIGAYESQQTSASNVLQAPTVRAGKVRRK